MLEDPLGHYFCPAYYVFSSHNNWRDWTNKKSHVSRVIKVPTIFICSCTASRQFHDLDDNFRKFREKKPAMLQKVTIKQNNLQYSHVRTDI